MMRFTQSNITGLRGGSNCATIGCQHGAHKKTSQLPTHLKHCGKKRQQERNAIHRKLELKKLLDVVVDGAPPHDGLDDGGEAVVEDDNVRGLLRDLCSRQTHCQADIGSLKSARKGNP